MSTGNFMAERVGFEPTDRFTGRLVSSEVPSATRPSFLSLQFVYMYSLVRFLSQYDKATERHED